MEYTKDIIVNVDFGRKINFKERKIIKKIIDVYNENKFIINILLLATTLIIIDLCMIYNFMNLLIRL